MSEEVRAATSSTWLLEMLRGFSSGVHIAAGGRYCTSLMEKKLIAIREEIAAIEKETVDESELTRALAAFNPIWDSLSLREQSRIMRLLIERMGLDGRDGKVTVTFRSAGIRALCTEAGLIGNEDLI